MPPTTKITPYLWFDGQAEQAAAFHASVFPNSRITRVTHFGEAGFEIITGRRVGDDGGLRARQPFTALNGGPEFRFTEAISFQVDCATKAELDRYWEKLAQGGDPKAQQCGWLKERFGVSWQTLPELVGDAGSEKSQRAWRR